MNQGIKNKAHSVLMAGLFSVISLKKKSQLSESTVYIILKNAQSRYLKMHRLDTEKKNACAKMVI